MFSVNPSLCPCAWPSSPKATETQSHNAGCGLLCSGYFLSFWLVTGWMEPGGELGDPGFIPALSLISRVTLGMSLPTWAWAMSVKDIMTHPVGYDKNKSGNSDPLLPVTCPQPALPFTTPFSVPRQPFGSHGGHEGDGGLPTLQALSPVLQLQDPGNGAPWVGQRRLRGEGRGQGLGVRSSSTDLEPKGKLLEA